MTLRIDLHLHTTASDGRCTPHQLVQHARAVGLGVMAVTDHDTVAAVAEVRALAAARGMEAVSGIEITAVDADRDVHVLGYFFDHDDKPLADFLAAQRQQRIARVEAITERLAALGVPIDAHPLLEDARRESEHSIGRPQVARALVAAGHVRDTREAFDRWLGRGRPAFVPRSGATVQAVIGIIHQAGGVASLAHPGQTAIDERIPALEDAGLDALEAYHSDHDAAQVERYTRLAGKLGLHVTGGSDYHGDPAHGLAPGSVTLPQLFWERLLASRPRK